MGHIKKGQQRAVAVFDIDGTVFRSSLVIEVFRALVAKRVFPRAAAARIDRTYLRWLNRKGHYNDYLMMLVKEFFRNLKGKEARIVNPIITSVVRQQKDRVYRFTRSLMYDLKRKGYFIIAISNSPDSMVTPFAKAAGFDAAVGRTYQVRDGRYTGVITVDGKPFPVIAWIDKVALLKKFMSSQGYAVDYPRSFAIGDTESDADLLAAVGNPIAFNPSAELLKIASKKHWKVVVERKDAMYIINDAQVIIAPERQRVRVS